MNTRPESWMFCFGQWPFAKSSLDRMSWSQKIQDTFSRKKTFKKEKKIFPETEAEQQLETEI